jgi:flagellar assembly protein FliH
MSSSYDPWTRSKVLRGHAAAARPAFLDTELGHAPTLSLIVTPEEAAPVVDDEQPVDDPAAEAYAAGYELGYVEGYNEGKAVGYADGYQAGNETAAAAALVAAEERDTKLREALAALTTAADECNDRQAASIADMERTIVDAVFDLAQTLLGRELSVTRTPGRDALARALSMVRDHGTVTARMNPTDIESIGDLAELAPGRVITIVADPDVEPAGCILEAGAMRVDAQLGPALERAKRALLGGNP